MNIKKLIKNIIKIFIKVIFFIPSIILQSVFLIGSLLYSKNIKFNELNNYILLIPNFTEFGGTRTYFKMLLEFYKKNNFNLIILLHKRQLDSEIIELVEKFHYTYVVRKNFNYFIEAFLECINLRYLYNIFFTFSIVLKFKPKLIVFSDEQFYLFSSLILLPIKMLFIVHSYPTKGINPVFKFILNKYLSNYKLIVTVSNFSKKNIIKYVTNRSEYIKVVYNGLKDSKVQRKEVKEIKILTIGHVTWYKNPELWIKVAKEVIKRYNKIPIEFIWVGDGDLISLCKSMVKDYTNIKFLGFYKQNDLKEFYSKTYIYFQPSKIESFGLSVLEAMKYGIPCIVSNNGGLPELVINNETGFVLDLNNFNEIVEKIIELIENKDLWNFFSKNSRLRYIQNFTYDIWEKQILDCHLMNGYPLSRV